jgi:hypothetical protein
MEKGLYAIVPVEDRRRPARSAAHAALTPTPLGWPAPGTLTQGWLSNRWNRRDGTVYGNVGVGRTSGPNSPIAGGEDTDAAVDVPSGAPRV